MILKQDLIITSLTADSAESALALSGERFVEEGFAHASFVEALIEREHHFPTGLPAQGRAVALPHCDVRHIIHPAVGVVTLAKPVVFHTMGDPEQILDVSILFVLGMKEPHAQPLLLSQIIEIIQDEDLLETVYKASTSQEVFELLKERIG